MQFWALLATVWTSSRLLSQTETSSDDIRAKIVNSTALSDIIALMEEERWELRQAATNVISGLVGYGMNLLQCATDWASSDDIRIKIMDSTALSNIVALMKEKKWELRRAGAKVISDLVGHGMNLL
jgi:hypothetical protein